MAIEVRILRGLESALPTLAEGQMGLCTDSYKVFVGSAAGNKQLATLSTANTFTAGQTITNTGSSDALTINGVGTKNRITAINGTDTWLSLMHGGDHPAVVWETGRLRFGTATDHDATYTGFSELASIGSDGSLTLGSTATVGTGALYAGAGTFGGTLTVQGTGNSSFAGNVLIGTTSDDNTNAKLQVAGAGNFGGATNHAKISDEGLQLYGTATMWDDLRISSSSVRLGNTAPTLTSGFAGNSTLYYLSFPYNSEKDIYFEIQMPHDWAGTAIYPHVHCTPSDGTMADGDIFEWTFEYSWKNIGSVFGASSTLALQYLSDGKTTSQWTHCLATNANGITPSASQNGISTMLVCRITRNTAVTGNSARAAAFLEFDLHYERDSLGSRSEYTK